MFGSGRFSISNILMKDPPGCLQKLAACGTFLLFSADRLTWVLFARGKKTAPEVSYWPWQLVTQSRRYVWYGSTADMPR
jgi:hypothetical protein